MQTTLPQHTFDALITNQIASTNKNLKILL
jgi:hypothetical protein